MEVTHPRWRVRGQRQRSPAAASTILHLHNNHTLEENRRCGNYNQQPTRGTQPHTILHLHKNHTQEKTWRCGLSYQQPTTGTTNNHPIHHPPQDGGSKQEMWQIQLTTNYQPTKNQNKILGQLFGSLISFPSSNQILIVLGLGGGGSFV